MSRHRTDDNRESKSWVDSSHDGLSFVPPERLGEQWSEAALDLESGPQSSGSDWDIAVRYHEFKSRPGQFKNLGQLRAFSAEAVLRRARAIIGSIVRPVIRETGPYDSELTTAHQVEINLEESIENNPRLEDLWVDYEIHRPQPLILAVDTSLSMTGEKLALTAVAVAVVLLEFPDDPVGIIAFENEARIIKRPEERLAVSEMVERFLDLPAQGYTHLEEGVRTALHLVDQVPKAGRQRPATTLLLTDGKYTAGKDPSYLAGRFDHLIVMKMGPEQSSRSLCQEMARAGAGDLYEVRELESLPIVMYGVIKDVLRGTRSPKRRAHEGRL